MFCCYSPATASTDSFSMFIFVCVFFFTFDRFVQLIIFLSLSVFKLLYTVKTLITQLTSLHFNEIQLVLASCVCACLCLNVCLFSITHIFFFSTLFYSLSFVRCTNIHTHSTATLTHSLTFKSHSILQQQYQTKNHAIFFSFSRFCYPMESFPLAISNKITCTNSLDIFFSINQ